MNLQTFVHHLRTQKNLSFVLENNTVIPPHFHITEIGLVTKKFIDCGGTARTKQVVNFQIWTALDFEHRLSPQKLLTIIEHSQTMLQLNNELEIEFEYQQQTINVFGVQYKNNQFILTNKHTQCLATDQCGVSADQLSTQNCCNTGCC